MTSLKPLQAGFEEQKEEDIGCRVACTVVWFEPPPPPASSSLYQQSHSGCVWLHRPCTAYTVVWALLLVVAPRDPLPGFQDLGLHAAGLCLSPSSASYWVTFAAAWSLLGLSAPHL